MSTVSAPRTNICAKIRIITPAGGATLASSATPVTTSRAACRAARPAGLRRAGTVNGRSASTARPRASAAQAMGTQAGANASSTPASTGPATPARFSSTAASTFAEASSAGVRTSQGSSMDMVGR
jgi:hypothetical protein